jgi:1-acyl-sn-glycerol-3-phosphate acyltransferase
MIKWICGLLLKIWGFKITGIDPNKIKKKVYVVVAHTSNWDFLLGILTKGYMGLDVQYVAKSSLFKWPYGWFFRMFGGIPVDRSKSNNFVEAVAEAIKKYDKISVSVAPEGTRKKVDKLKSGFYYIAKAANVPIVPVKFDFKNKVVDFGNPFTTTDDSEKDLMYFNDYFKDTVGKIPENSYGYPFDAIA